RDPHLAPLAIQYADFARWQREALQGGSLQKHLAYWKQQLEGAPALLPLPTDYPRPALQGQSGAREMFTYRPELTAGLLALSREAGGTLFMPLLAAFAVLLGRYTGQDDLLVGTPVAGRTRQDTEGLIGCFVNTIPLRVRLGGSPTFRELLLQVRDTALA